MDDQKQRLAIALRDLCGWHVGMVTTTGEVVTGACSGSDEILHAVLLHPSPGFRDRRELYAWRCLPDLDAPANHGVWEAYVREHSDGHVLIRHMPSWSRVGVGGREYKSTCYATALLGAYVRWAGLSDLPPEVLAWWELEQAEVSDA